MPIRNRKVAKCGCDRFPRLALVMAVSMACPVSAQVYTGTANNAVGDVQTVYDGIGTVTALPGGTSVLERVLAAVEHLNLGSSGSMAPVDGVYANIAESAMQREWYATDRTEIAYEDYVANVITPTTDGLTWANISAPPAESDFTTTATLTDPNDPENHATISDMTFMKIYVFQNATADDTNFAIKTPYYQYFGSMEYSFSEMAAIPSTGTNLIPDGASAVTGANLTLYSNGDVRLQNASSGGIVAVVEVAGQAYLLDSFNNLKATVYPTLDPAYVDLSGYYAGTAGYDATPDTSVPYFDPVTKQFDYSQDIVGDGVSSYNNSIFPFSGVVDSTTVAWVDADGDPATPNVLQIVPSDYLTANTDTATTATYTYDVAVPTNFTRQLNSIYEDWNQRDLPSVIDGSVTNTITGVTEATARAATAAGTASAFFIPTIDIANIATTALGAVNTGEIAVGATTAVNEATTSTARAVSASLVLVGGSAEAGTMMLNIAHNTSIIQGNVVNNMIAMNGSVANISTTTLGAVNTGTIANGINTAVQGIVGQSGQF